MYTQCPLFDEQSCSEKKTSDCKLKDTPLIANQKLNTCSKSRIFSIQSTEESFDDLKVIESIIKN